MIRWNSLSIGARTAIAIYVVGALLCIPAGIRWLSDKPTTYKHKDFYSADDLANEYYANELAADAKFKDRTTPISGIVSSVGRTITGEPYVVLKTRRLMGIQCVFDKLSERKLANLKIGEVIFAVGIVRGKTLGAVIVDKCKLVAPVN